MSHDVTGDLRCGFPALSQRMEICEDKHAASTEVAFFTPRLGLFKGRTPPCHFNTYRSVNQSSAPANIFPPLPSRTHPCNGRKTLKEGAIKNESFCPQCSARLSTIQAALEWKHEGFGAFFPDVVILPPTRTNQWLEIKGV